MKNSLLSLAKADLATASLILENPKNEGLFGMVCFHAQQTVEKALKYYIEFSGEDYPFIHNLETLLEISEKYNSDLVHFAEQVKILTGYYSDPRYDFLAPINQSKEEAQEAYNMAEEIYNFIYRLISNK